MPLPPRGDPQRPIELAIRSTRLLGFVSAAFGLVIVVGYGYFNRMVRFRPHFIALGTVVWFVPGVLFLTASSFMRRRSRAAVIAAAVTAAGQALFATAIFVASLTVQPVSPIPVILAALWAAALGQLLTHLWQSLESVRVDTAHVHGFELSEGAAQAPRRVLPLEADASRGADAEQPGGGVSPGSGAG